MGNRLDYCSDTSATAEIQQSVKSNRKDICICIISKFTLLITGTVVSNGPKNCKSLVDVIDPKYFPFQSKEFYHHYPQTIDGCIRLREK